MIDKDDSISRKGALKICRRYWHPTSNPIMEEIEKLPPTQPEIIRCKDCKYWRIDSEGERYCDRIVGVSECEDGSGYCSDAERR